jgi:hypothetical protein
VERVSAYDDDHRVVGLAVDDLPWSGRSHGCARPGVTRLRVVLPAPG